MSPDTWERDGALGVLLFAARGPTSPYPMLGIDIYVDPGGPWLIAPPAASNAIGGAYFGLPLPADPALVNQHASAQLVWAGPTSSPCPPLGLSASNALEITIQP